MVYAVYSREAWLLRNQRHSIGMAFNTLPSRREELVVQRERLLTGEIGRIDALLKTLDG